MADVKAGATAAIEALGPGAPPDDDAEQLDLLGLRPVPVATLMTGAVERRRGPGRPPGARNKRTEGWVEYLTRRYGSPLEVLMQMAMQPVEELAVQLGCTRLEAWQEKRQAATAALPFVHQRQPLAVQIDSRGIVQLVIEAPGDFGPTREGTDDGTLVLEGRIVEPENQANPSGPRGGDEAEENQPLSGDKTAELDNGELDSST